MKAAPLLRAWLKRLQDRGVTFRYRHEVINVSDLELSVVDIRRQQHRTVLVDAVVLPAAPFHGRNWAAMENGKRGCNQSRFSLFRPVMWVYW